MARWHKWVACCLTALIMVALFFEISPHDQNHYPEGAIRQESIKQASEKDTIADGELLAPDVVEETETDDVPAKSSPDLPRLRPPDPLLADIVSPRTQTTGPANNPPQVTAVEAQLTLQTFLHKLSLQEKAMVLKLVTKFSPGEVVEVFRLYQQGGREAYRSLDAIIMAKVSEDEFERLRALTHKYR